jgi:hypothetical protein
MIYRPILVGESLSLTISGLDIMNDDPSDATVLYAKVKPNSQMYVLFFDRNMRIVLRLQTALDRLYDRMCETDLMSQQKRNNIKLHMTLMNTKFIEVKKYTLWYKLSNRI